MSDKEKKAEHVKNLAAKGEFEVIKSDFGRGANEKAKAYMLKKLQSLLASKLRPNEVESPFLSFAFSFVVDNKEEPAEDSVVDMDKIISAFERNMLILSGSEKSSQPSDEAVSILADSPVSGKEIINGGRDLYEESSQANRISEDESDQGDSDCTQKQQTGAVSEDDDTSKEEELAEVEDSDSTQPQDATIESGEVKKKIPKVSKSFTVVDVKGKGAKAVITKMTKNKIAKGKKVKKEKKDPNKPKAAKAAYIYFGMHIRPEIMEKQPGISASEIMKETGALWQALGAKDREPFETLAQADKTRATEERAAYALSSMDRVEENVVQSAGSDTLAAKKTTPRKKTEKAVAEIPTFQVIREEFSDSDDSIEAKKKKRKKSSTGGGRNINIRHGTKKTQQVADKTHTGKRAKIESTEDCNTASTTSQGRQKKRKGDSEVFDDSIFMPLKTTPFSADWVPRVGMQVTLVLQPYREFLDSLTGGAILNKKEVTDICSSSKHTVSGKVEKITTVTENPEGLQCEVTVLIGGEAYAVLFVPFSSPLLCCDQFMLGHKEFIASLRSPWLAVNARVIRSFSSDDGSHLEWLEGCIYHIGDLTENPYKAVLVVWIGVEEDGWWSYRRLQVDNECSPWDLHSSNNVSVRDIKPRLVPSSLKGRSCHPQALISHLRSCDFAFIFEDNLSGTIDYCDFQESVEDPADFRVLQDKCDAGQFDSTSSSASSPAGLIELFKDLKKMTTSAKKFNNCNQGFLPWRLVDMMEKYLDFLVVELLGEVGVAAVMGPQSDGEATATTIAVICEDEVEEDQPEEV